MPNLENFRVLEVSVFCKFKSFKYLENLWIKKKIADPAQLNSAWAT
jgi:hypothetical protein